VVGVALIEEESEKGRPGVSTPPYGAEMVKGRREGTGKVHFDGREGG